LQALQLYRIILCVLLRNVTLRYVNISTTRNGGKNYPIYSNVIGVLLNFRITQDDILTVDVQTHVVLTSTLAVGERSAPRPSRFTSGETAPVTHWIGGWVGPRTDLDDVKKIIIPTGTRTPTPQSLSL
jgi:hypothetical protein